MTALAQNPFPFYTDGRGDPLDQGYVYLGEVDADPELFPIAVYWDKDLTVPAVQPLRTANGYVVNGTSPANVFTADPYSIRIKDKDHAQVFYASEVSPGGSANDNGCCLPNPRQYGAQGDGATDDYDAFVATLSACTTAGTGMLITPGTYLIESDLTIDCDVFPQPGASFKIANGVTVMFLGRIDDTVRQLFSYVGTGTVNLKRLRNEYVRPEWWGGFPSMNGDSPTDALFGIQQALDRFPVVQLSKGSYYTSDTVRLRTTNNTLRGVVNHYVGYDGADAQLRSEAQFTASRVVVMSGVHTAVLMGLDAYPGSINAMPFNLTLQDVLCTPNQSPINATNQSVVRAQFCVQSALRRVIANEGIFSFQFRGSVKTVVEECYAQRTMAGSGGGTDRWYGFYVDGNANIGTSGGNASLYFFSCNATGTTNTAQPYGLSADHYFSDLFIKDFETVGCQAGIYIKGYDSGTHSAADVVGNQDCRIEHPVIDGFTGAGIWLDSINKYGCVEIIDPYFAPAAGALNTNGIFLTEVAGRVYFRGGQIPAYYGGTTFTAVNAIDCETITIDGLKILECAGVAVKLNDVNNCRIQPECQNFIKVLTRLVLMQGACNYNIVEPLLYGNNAFCTRAIEMQGITNNWNEIRVTGITQYVCGAPATAKVSINGVNITTVGLHGANIVTGILGSETP